MLKFKKINEENNTPFDTSILDGISDPVLIVDEQELVIDYNKAYKRLLEADPSKTSLHAFTNNENIKKTIKRCLTGNPTLPSEVYLPNPIGLFYDVKMWRLPDLTAKSPVWAMIVLSDVTSTRRMEKVRSDFVANVSHELRSPLSALLGFIETLQGPARSDPEASARFLSIMESEAKRMARLIDELLTLSKVEADEHITPDDVIAVDQIISEVASSLSVRAMGKGMKLRTSVEKDLPPITGDADELAQVFQNLVSNAINYGSEDTDIRLDIGLVDNLPETGAPGIFVSITNHGEGIPAQEIPRLTERFYRVDKGRSRSMGGTGLGLAIVKHIVARHRGHLEVKSEVNKETCFTVMLPRSDENIL